MEAEMRSQPVRSTMEILSDPAAMRGLLLTYTEKVIALEAENAELVPKTEALDRIATADGSLCITDAAKTLQVRPKDLSALLRARGWVYSRMGCGVIAGQARINSGHLEHKTTVIRQGDGHERVVSQVRVTPKGLARLSAMLSPAAGAAAH
jgi:anti-repressor protein